MRVRSGRAASGDVTRFGARSGARIAIDRAGRVAGESVRIALLRTRRAPLRLDPSSDVVVSMTSFAGRITSVWIALETVIAQTHAPRAIVLALAEEEFPGRRLPATLRRQERRGLTILWTQRNGHSYDKLLPALRHFPDARIVTVDDDKWYRPTFLAELVAASDALPGAIVGHHGLAIAAPDGQVDYRLGWRRADRATPPGRVFLIGANGILYPPGSVPEAIHDLDLAERLTPRNDDHWFFAMGRLGGRPSYALGSVKATDVRPWVTTPSLSAHNIGERNRIQFRAVLEHFGLEGALLDACGDQGRSDALAAEPGPASDGPVGTDAV